MTRLATFTFSPEKYVTLDRWHEDKSYMIVRFKYDLEYIEFIKTIPGRKYMKVYRCWIVPDTVENRNTIGEFRQDRWVVFLGSSLSMMEPVTIKESS